MKQRMDKSQSKDSRNGQHRNDAHEAVNGHCTEDENVEISSEVTISLEEYEKLKATIEELQDLHLRAAADFDNYRKRMGKEREMIVCFANESLISDLLPVLDNLDRALGADHDGSHSGDIFEGVRMISGQLHKVLQQCGLEPVQSIGEPFDPNIHEAVGVLPSPEHDEGMVVSELQKGYRLKGKVVRPSIVHVAGDSQGNSENGDED